MKFDKNIFYKACRLILIGQFLSILTVTTKGQTKTKRNSVDVEIHGGQNGNLYTNGSNLISVLSKDTTLTFSLKSSQGIVWQLDKYMFFVDSLKKGKATIMGRLQKWEGFTLKHHLSATLSSGSGLYRPETS